MGSGREEEEGLLTTAVEFCARGRLELFSYRFDRLSNWKSHQEEEEGDDRCCCCHRRRRPPALCHANTKLQHLNDDLLLFFTVRSKS